MSSINEKNNKLLPQFEKASVLLSFFTVRLQEFCQYQFFEMDIRKTSIRQRGVSRSEKMDRAIFGLFSDEENNPITTSLGYEVVFLV